MSKMTAFLRNVTLPAEWVPVKSSQFYKSILKRVRPYSMAPKEAIEFTISETLRVIENNIPGDLAELGTWKGGNCFAMLLAQRAAYGRVVKPVWMFDSFQGLPDADERDGPA